MQVLLLNVNTIKDSLSGRIKIAPTDPGAWHLHRETTLSWAAQMCVEFVNDKGLWECPSGKDNHAWDCSCYNLAAGIFFVGDYKKKLEAKSPTAKRRVINRGIHDQ